MPSYDIFFFGSLFFLIGVFLASFGAGIWILVIAFITAVFFFLLVKLNFTSFERFFWLTGLLVFILVGAVYYTWDDMRFREGVNIPFDERQEFSGVVVSDPLLKSGSQEFKLKLNPPLGGNILIKTARYPEFSYGDELKIEGKAKPPYSESYGRYLAKENISGVVTFAKAEKTGSDRASAIKKSLFVFKHKIGGSFQRTLPPKESALLSGLTLGERGEFSEDFKEAMSKSGTTHLVALSGYNITIIADTMVVLLAWFLIRRRLSFLITVFVILGFVVMTGGEASVVRAAVMGFLVLLARDTGRFFDFRNAITLAGLVMVLHNPKILVFDVGFQLSFLALFGIVYLKPAIVRFFRVTENSGILSWRDNFLTTAAAQLMVIPLLVSNFGSFSPSSLLANVVVLEMIPVTMGLGFVMAAFSFVSYHISLLLGFLVQILLVFEIFAIEFFAKTSVSFAPTIGIFSFVLYYVAIISFIIYVNKKHGFRLAK